MGLEAKRGRSLLPDLMLDLNAADYRAAHQGVSFNLDPVVDDARGRWERTRRDPKRSNDSDVCSHGRPLFC